MNPIDLLPVVLSFAGTLVLTPVVRALARRRGVVARPKSDRWHKKPTALLGGGAIFTVVAAVNLALVPLTPQARVVLGAGSFLFLVGLIDDFFSLKPYQKLSGQIMGAAVVVGCGLTLPWTGSPPVNMAITLFWLIGINNAVNLLDNMDGLAAGLNELSAGSVIAGLSVKLPDPAARVLELSLERQRALFYVVDQLKQAQLVSDFGSITARVLDPPVATENRPSILLVLIAAPAQCHTMLSSSPLSR